jgi:N-acetyl-gamma-glutamyl-phosphate reductase
LKNKLINLDHIVVDSKSGTSGAGIKPSETLHHPTCNENIRAYSVTGHRHSPEIQQEAQNLAGGKANTHFTPHLIPISRGILNTSHVFLKNEKSEPELIEIYKKFYKKCPFVRVLKDLPQTNAVKGSNFCDIGIRVSEKTNRAIIVSAIDNLVKGASGQAIQNMNINFGLDEIKGLEGIPYRP